MALLRRLAFVLTGALWLCVAASRTWAQPASEFDVKAAFLYNFVRFVEWPVEVFSDSTVLVFGVLGSDPFRGSLERVVEDTEVDGRPLRVAKFKQLAEIDSCHVLFIATSERDHMSETLETLSGRAILTVSDLAGFAQAGGMIQFVLRDNRVRFEINVAAARQAKLRISSRLLRLAIRVYDNEG